MMKKLWLIPILAFLFACGPASAPQEAESTVGITAPDGYAVSCVTNYIRVVPHFCLRTLVQAAAIGTVDGTCRLVDWNALLSIPTSARAVMVQAIGAIRSNNAISARQLRVNYFSDVACASNVINTTVAGREFAAVTAGGTIYETSDVIVTLLNGVNMYYTATTLDGAAHGVSFQLIGYYD